MLAKHQATYKEGALGWRLVLSAQDEYRLGKINGMKVTLKDNDELETKHRIAFPDGKGEWVDLDEVEKKDQLSWVTESGGDEVFLMADKRRRLVARLGRHVIMKGFADEEEDSEHDQLVLGIGQVQAFKVLIQKSGNIKTRQWIVFDNGEADWFDVKQECKKGQLTWINEGNKSSKKKKKRSRSTEDTDEKHAAGSKSNKKKTKKQKIEYYTVKEEQAGAAEAFTKLEDVVSAITQSNVKDKVFSPEDAKVAKQKVKSGSYPRDRVHYYNKVVRPKEGKKIENYFVLHYDEGKGTIRTIPMEPRGVLSGKRAGRPRFQAVMTNFDRDVKTVRCADYDIVEAFMVMKTPVVASEAWDVLDAIVTKRTDLVVSEPDLPASCNAPLFGMSLKKLTTLTEDFMENLQSSAAKAIDNTNEFSLLYQFPARGDGVIVERDYRDKTNIGKLLTAWHIAHPFPKGKCIMLLEFVSILYRLLLTMDLTSNYQVGDSHSIYTRAPGSKNWRFLLQLIAAMGYQYAHGYNTKPPRRRGGCTTLAVLKNVDNNRFEEAMVMAQVLVEIATSFTGQNLRVADVLNCSLYYLDRKKEKMTAKKGVFDDFAGDSGGVSWSQYLAMAPLFSKFGSLLEEKNLKTVFSVPEDELPKIHANPKLYLKASAKTGRMVLPLALVRQYDETTGEIESTQVNCNVYFDQEGFKKQRKG